MKFSIRNLIKPIFGIFLFGLALWFSPIEVSAYDGYGVSSYIPNGSLLPYEYSFLFPTELNTTNPSSYAAAVNYIMPFDSLPITPNNTGVYSFDINLDISFHNIFHGVSCDGVILCQFTVYYYDINGNSQTYRATQQFRNVHFDEDTEYPIIHFSVPVTIQGNPYQYSASMNTAYPGYAFMPWVFNVSPSYSGSAIPDSSSGTNTFTITGYSEPVNSHNQDINLIGNGHNAGSGYTGYVSFHSSAITLTGSVPFNSPDYDISFTQQDVDPSGSRFIFGFNSTIDNFQELFDYPILSHTNQIDLDLDDVNRYLNSIDVWTIDSNQTLHDINQQFQDFFDYQPPNTQTFNSDKSTVDSSINSVSTFQSSAFSGLSSAVNDTGLDNFDFAEYGPQMSYVGLLLTSVYNIFPNKFRYVIYFALFVGFFGVLLNAGSYIKKMRDSE